MGAAVEMLAATPSGPTVAALRRLAGKGSPPGAGQRTHTLGETASGCTPASRITGTSRQRQVTATLPPQGSVSTNDVICCASGARLAQPVERKALNLVVVGSSPTVGAAAETLAAAPSGPAVAALRASLARAVRQGQAGGHIPWGRLWLDAPLRPGSRAPEGSARSQQLCHRAQSLRMMSSAVHQEPA